MLLFTALAILLLATTVSLIPLGLRAGDRPGDALLLSVEPHAMPRGALVTVTNPGGGPVLLGMQLRRAGTRLHLEGGTYVRIRTGSTRSELRAETQARLAVLDARETQTLMVPAGAGVGRRAELVTVVGQDQRLRAIHRLVVLPAAARLEVGSGSPTRLTAHGRV